MEARALAAGIEPRTSTAKEAQVIRESWLPVISRRMPPRFGKEIRTVSIVNPRILLPQTTLFQRTTWMPL
jgi:hypothetical protein